MRNLVKFSVTMLAVAAMAACSDDSPTDPNDDDDNNNGGGNNGATATMALAGNIVQCGFASETRAAATAAIIDTLPATTIVVPLGDNVMNGTLAGYNDCYQETWGKFLSRTRPVFGNHENLSPGDYFVYFGSAAGTPGEGWYSYDAGPWHVITLRVHDNAVYNSASPQMQFLASDLAANSEKRCTMAVFHDSYFQSSNTAGFFTRPDKKHIWQALYDAGVDLVVTGGQHQYERMQPMDANGVVDQARGIVQINAGTGGESKVGTVAFMHPNQAAWKDAYGVLVLKLRSNGADFTFESLEGAADDNGSITCH